MHIKNDDLVSVSKLLKKYFEFIYILNDPFIRI